MDAIYSKPLITTIIPTYRRPKLLQRAILSVLNQTYPHLQVCVYDNASGDHTATVVADIAKWDPRVKYHCQPYNIGSIPNFNYGMKQVTTPFFSLLADDNTLLPYFLGDAIDTLNRYPEAVLFAGKTILINEKGQKIGGSLHRWEPGLIFPPDGLADIWEKGLTWESVLFRSEVIKSVGLLDASVDGSADEEFMMRIARKHVFYVSKKPCALFLYHDNSLTVTRDLGEYISSSKRILEQWLKDEDLSAAIKKRITKRWKIFVKEKISGYLYTKSIIGDDTETIALASELMNQEVGISYKPLRAIIIAKLVNYNRFLRILVSSPIYWYIELKRKLIILKRRKTYADVNTYSSK